jgi:hypothetical protein
VHGEVREKARHSYRHPAPAAVTRQLDPAVDLLMHHVRLKLRKGGACMLCMHVAAMCLPRWPRLPRQHLMRPLLVQR